MTKRTSKSILDIPKPPRVYGAITCLEVLERRISYQVSESQISAHYDGEFDSMCVLTLKFKDKDWRDEEIIEDLHFCHYVSAKLRLTYNQLYNQLVVWTRQYWMTHHGH